MLRLKPDEVTSLDFILLILSSRVQGIKRVSYLRSAFFFSFLAHAVSDLNKPSSLYKHLIGKCNISPGNYTSVMAGYNRMLGLVQKQHTMHDA